MKGLYFATTNANKMAEAERILGFELMNREVEIAEHWLDIPEIQSLDVYEVARDKVRKAYFNVGRKPVMVEDTGLYFDALSGYPGALIKWAIKPEEGLESLVNSLQGKRKFAKAKTCYAIFNGFILKTFTGETSGYIVPPRGETNFGWDPIFQPLFRNKTFAEMTPEEKDSVSMRARALKQVKEYIDNNPHFLRGELF